MGHPLSVLIMAAFPKRFWLAEEVAGNEKLSQEYFGV